jgi:glutathione synthase/RimK-type ligase-like ATP-grasp enzyme
MGTQLIVVEDAADWAFADPGCPVVDADDYLTGQEYFRLRNVQIINLCRSYRYLSVAYYCSLLGEARRHRVIPSVKSMLDLSSKAMYGLDAVNLDELVQKSFKKQPGDPYQNVFEMDVFFGNSRHEALSDLARQIFETFPCPLLRVALRRQDRWHITSIKPLALHRLAGDGREFFIESLARYLKRRWRSPRTRTPARYDLAVLHNPDDPLPPSDKRALQNFIRAGAAQGVAVELIERKDYARLAEYDALFIRDTTRINHYTYRFAKKSESEGMVVIDDPQSILRCTNKVYLAELLRANRVPAPKTVIAGRNDLKAAEEAIGFPMVIKVPDGSFSQGVYKAETGAQLRQVGEGLFKSSELILAQEFLYTEFDWRIGVLNRRPIFASQYFMSKQHWKIVNYDASGKAIEGGYKTCAVEDAPAQVVKVALKAANLIGDGLYGVDVKQNRDGVYVIEVNDNPNLEAGVEDFVLKDELYRLIIAEFVRRLELRRAVEH